MRAVTIKDGHLEVADRELRDPVADEVLVQVSGAGLNRADLLQVAGLYPSPAGAPPDVPGLEFAGSVVAVGPGVQSLAPGSRVFGLVGGGGQAEQVLTTEDLCAPVPSGLDLVEAGGIPEVFVTAHDAMITQARLRPGERVLVHAVGSGVGTAVVQIAVATGAEVVGTARTPDKLERARELGMSKGIVVSGGPDPSAISSETGPCDVVIDLVGGEYLNADLMAAAPKGRVVIVGLLAGPIAHANLALLLGKRLSVTGTVLRARARHEKAAATAAFSAQMGPLFARGALRPVIEKILPLEEAPAAYELLGSDRTFGKVLLVP
jgi:putative PIG3 family NAD(P)H quinone oxidoreductase